MAQLTSAQKDVVRTELLLHVATLKSLRSDRPGVPGQTLMCAPYRVHRDYTKTHSCWRPRPEAEEQGGYVFCHNDLSQHNVLVDPETLTIKAIVDWEYGGFWPEWFERPYWERTGPSVPLQGELDDVERCRDWLAAQCEEVVMPHLLSLQEKLQKDQEKDVEGAIQT